MPSTAEKAAAATQERIVLAPGTRVYSRPSVCGRATCSVCGGTGTAGRGHGQIIDLHLPGHPGPRRYVGLNLVDGRDNLPLLVEQTLIERAEDGDGELPAEFVQSLKQLAKRRDSRQVSELAEAAARAQTVFGFSRFVLRETGFSLGDLLALPASVVKALQSERPLLVVAVPMGPGNDQRELVDSVRAIVAKSGNYDATLGAALRLAGKVSANVSKAFVPLADFYDERLVVFVCHPDEKVVAELGQLDGPGFVKTLRAARPSPGRSGYQHRPRRVRIVLPWVARLNDPSGEPGLLRIDRNDGAALALVNDRLATSGFTYPVLCEIVRPFEEFESIVTASAAAVEAATGAKSRRKVARTPSALPAGEANQPFDQGDPGPFTVVYDEKGRPRVAACSEKE